MGIFIPEITSFEERLELGRVDTTVTSTAN
jgi:hypothetical protein